MALAGYNISRYIANLCMSLRNLPTYVLESYVAGWAKTNGSSNSSTGRKDMLGSWGGGDTGKESLMTS